MRDRRRVVGLARYPREATKVGRHSDHEISSVF